MFIFCGHDNKGRLTMDLLTREVKGMVIDSGEKLLKSNLWPNKYTPPISAFSETRPKNSWTVLWNIATLKLSISLAQTQYPSLALSTLGGLSSFEKPRQCWHGFLYLAYHSPYFSFFVLLTIWLWQFFGNLSILIVPGRSILWPVQFLTLWHSILFCAQAWTWPCCWLAGMTGMAHSQPLCFVFHLQSWGLYFFSTYRINIKYILNLTESVLD